MELLGIVFSGRVRSALLCALALWMLLFMATSAGEIFVSYLGGTGFDTTAQDVIMIGTALFLPYYVVAAVLLRSLAARLALFHKLRRQIVVPEYMPPEVLSPAEAGWIANNDFTLNEIAATLKDLELRRCISITKQGVDLVVRPLNMAGASKLEQAFITSLIRENGEYSTAGASAAAQLLDAGHVLAGDVREQLVRQGVLPANRRRNAVTRAVTKVLLWVALLVQAVLTWGVLSRPYEIFHVGYPRYPMNFSEPLLEVLSIVLVFGIVISGFWQRSLNDAHGLKNWRYVAGLRMFIEKVYKDRFYRDGKQIAAASDMHAFYPYALALGVERRFTDELKRALAL